MLGDTISITYNAVSKVLSKINQDSYTSEYLLKEATQEFRMKVRHSKERATNGSPAFDRHNVELTHTVYPTVVGAQSRVTQAYAVIRNLPEAVPADVALLSGALTGYMTAANVGKIVGWES